jgi:serine protease inhibitor
MTRRRKIESVVIAGILVVVGVIASVWGGLLLRSSPRSAPSASANGTEAVAVSRHAIAAADESLGLRIYEQLRERRGNFVFSPYSIATALRMLGAGAKGQTATELAVLLHNPTDDMSVHTEAGELGRLLHESGQEPITLKIGNGLWLHESERLVERYAKLLHSHYQAHTEFFRAPAQGVDSINRWISDQTCNTIPQAFEPGHWNPDWRFVMVNTVYYKAQWKFKFDRAATRPMTFHTNNRRSREVAMMTQNATLPLAQFPEACLLELPYAGQDFRMMVVLPKEVDGLNAVESLMLQGALARWIDGLREEDVTVFLPVFDAEVDFDLKSLISELGATALFDPGRADFSGISPRKDPLWVDVARHQAFFKVDEDGTEAGAMTRFMMMRGGGPHPVVFRADHPFLFVLIHRPTNSKLFLGRIIEPI